MEYDKPWLPVEAQVERLREQDLLIDDPARARLLLESVGYYRLIGYLYPYREGAVFRPGTTLAHAEGLIDFDRELRLLFLDGLERVEVALRMRIAYVLGRHSAFAYEDPAYFTESFTAEEGEPSKHAQWLQGVRERQADSDEWFVQHFRKKYDDRMPVWALTEILELGQLAVLYRGLRVEDAVEVAEAFGVPTKAMMGSWLASLNYVRNLAAHYARLFNRRLLYTPTRPGVGLIPVLDHLRDAEAEERKFSTYNALAVIAYLMRSIDPAAGWAEKAAGVLRSFPTSEVVTVAALGAPAGWEGLELWAQK
ncbi:Abi family protein [Corynebacterium nasicanis]|uniref:Abi family protein n=1 Tax=Corynebacterium nasicanis TaxID=1448267 RepID=A0ABW1QCS2_9CORY